MLGQGDRGPQRVFQLLFLGLHQTVKGIGMPDLADKPQMRAISVLELGEDA